MLDLLTVPLRGSRLLEASAGTGKTWTLAALMLRLVLGHGGAADAPPRALWPSEILVMTFTRAATRELRERIRARLVEAAAAFRRETVPAEPFLAALWQAFADGGPRQAAAWRLARAAESMDDAAIHTIDAWCQRMLREHAFDSGSPFVEELDADESQLHEQAARDYWRQHVYPLNEMDAADVLQVWPTVEALADDSSRLSAGPLPGHDGDGPLSDCLAAARRRRTLALEALAQGWPARAAQMWAWLEPRLGPGGPFNRKRLQRAHCRRWLDDLEAWAAEPEKAFGRLQTLHAGTGATRLTPAGLQELADQAALEGLPDAFAAFESLMGAVSRLPGLAPALRLHAAVRVAERVQHLKRVQQTFGFEDQLRRLDRALDPAFSGPAAGRLRERVLEQYPVALIDEFQDTSALQLHIFDSLYRVADDDPARLLLLIGDPKQSIYGFRGADIHSYLWARQATRGRHERLGTNHRSTQALVAAVNAVFSRAEDRDGDGAFRFRRAPTATGGDGRADNPLPFWPVGARGRAERLEVEGAESAALTFCVDLQPRPAPQARERMAEHAAQCIVNWLSGGRLAQRGEGAEPLDLATASDSRRVVPGDIAVLVRSAAEAGLVRQALERRGVPSVYLSDRDSVFASAEAVDLLRLLAAVAAPRDLRLARAALATALIGSSLAELLERADDDAVFEDQLQQLRELQGVWRLQGVLAMVRRALHAFGVPGRCLSAPADGRPGGGERRLTNALHLAELLQRASEHQEGERALIQWLAARIADATSGRAATEDQILRLESDADRVQVVTVHKSKGLQYPLVCLPFASAVSSPPAADAVLLPGPDGTQAWRFEPTAADREALERSRLQEDLRLLYVALTRAELACWVGAPVLAAPRSGGAAARWAASALGYLLTGTDEFTPERVLGALAEVQQMAAMRPRAADVPGGVGRNGASGVDRVSVTVLDEGPVDITRWRPPGAPLALRPASSFTALFDRRWAISSYSALVRDAGRTGDAGQADATGLGVAWDSRLLGWRLDEPRPNVAPAPAVPAEGAPDPWMSFPRGAVAGNFLHAQLEWLAGENFALAGSADLQQALLRRCERASRGAWADPVLQWMLRLCEAPLGPTAQPLPQLSARVPEMEFWFPSDGLDAREIDQLCRQQLFPGRERPVLPARRLHGLLMGFADLVVEHRGCYWVLDYKSNDLGQRPEDYGAASRQAAILEHRYEVQAVLYLLALHRLLRARLGAAYRPHQQLGGAMIWFIRGVSGPQSGCESISTPWALIEALDAAIEAGASAAVSAVAGTGAGRDAPGIAPEDERGDTPRVAGAVDGGKMPRAGGFQ